MSGKGLFGKIASAFVVTESDDTPPDDRDELREQILLGFEDFARDHAVFFSHVNLPDLNLKEML